MGSNISFIVPSYPDIPGIFLRFFCIQGTLVISLLWGIEYISTKNKTAAEIWKHHTLTWEWPQPMRFFWLAEIIFPWFEISCKWALVFYHPQEVSQMALYSKPSISSRHPFVYSCYWPTVFLHSTQYLSSTSERRLRCGQDYICAWFATMVGMMLHCPVCTTVMCRYMMANFELAVVGDYITMHGWFSQWETTLQPRIIPALYEYMNGRFCYQNAS